MGRSKETFAVGTSRCLLFHSFSLHVPEQLNHRTESLPTPLLRKLHLAAPPVYACWMARAPERKKKKVLGGDCDKTAPTLRNGYAGNSSTQVLLL